MRHFISVPECVFVCVCAGECFVRRTGLLEYIWSSSALAVWHTLGHGFVLCCENCDCSLTADAQHNSPERFSDQMHLVLSCEQAQVVFFLMINPQKLKDFRLKKRI